MTAPSKEPNRPVKDVAEAMAIFEKVLAEAKGIPPAEDQPPPPSQPHEDVEPVAAPPVQMTPSGPDHFEAALLEQLRLDEDEDANQTASADLPLPQADLPGVVRALGVVLEREPGVGVWFRRFLDEASFAITRGEQYSRDGWAASRSLRSSGVFLALSLLALQKPDAFSQRASSKHPALSSLVPTLKAAGQENFVAWLLDRGNEKALAQQIEENLRDFLVRHTPARKVFVSTMTGQADTAEQGGDETPWREAAFRALHEAMRRDLSIDEAREIAGLEVAKAEPESKQTNFESLVEKALEE